MKSVKYQVLNEVRGRIANSLAGLEFSIVRFQIELELMDTLANKVGGHSRWPVEKML